MFIREVNIVNFKHFNTPFKLVLNKELNILVGNNEAGKSTILEAIHLALSGFFYGKYFKYELTQDLFNNTSVDEYLSAVNSAQDSENTSPPQILIELFFEDITDDSIKALFEGNGNTKKKKECGIQFKVAFNETHRPYYEELVKTKNMKSLPIEYYDFSWSTFARDDKITTASIPIKSAFIDSSASRFQNGSDVYISRILKDHLDPKDAVSITQAHRKMRDTFNEDEAVKNINKILENALKISDKQVELSVDLSSRNAWETSLVTYLDKVPFHLIGKGEQAVIKTRLALSHKKTQEANIILMEEPENHLSHSKLNELLGLIEDGHNNKQIIISTHSSFVSE